MKRVYWYFLAIAVLVIATVLLYLVYPYTTEYVLSQHISHYIFAFVFSIALIPLLPKAYKERFNHFVFIMLPSLFASGFPDLIYFLSYILNKGTVTGILINHNMFYYIFHKWLPSLLAVPITFLIVCLVMYFINKTEKREFPKNWFVYALIISLFCVLLHILVMDKIGF